MTASDRSDPARQGHGPSDAGDLRAILDAVAEPLFTIDAEGRVLDVNSAAEAALGHRRENALGLELVELIMAPEEQNDRRRELRLWLDASAADRATEPAARVVEMWAVRADGTEFPAELSVRRVGAGGSSRLTACVRDVSARRDAEQRAYAAELRYTALADHLPLISYVAETAPLGAGLRYVSPQVETLLGRTPAEWLASAELFEASIHPEDRSRVLEAKRVAYALGEALRLEYRMIAADGTVIWVDDLSVHVASDDGPPFRQGFALDITERKQTEQALREAETRYRTLVEQLPLAVYIDRVDRASSNIYTSPQIELMLGYTTEEWRSDPSLFVELLHPDDREGVLAAHAATHATGVPLQMDYRLTARDGRTIWVHDEARMITDPAGDGRVLQGYLLDITDRREAEDLLRHQAFHDPVTGLANRALFHDRVEHALVRLSAGGRVAVLFLDLDDFKRVNDTMGHLAGDTLLRAVGTRLRETLSPSHTVARLGGDEFAVLLEDVEAGTAVDAAATLLEELHDPFPVGGHDVFVTASIGVAVGDDADLLLRSADVAMYRAKAGGKSQYVAYTPRMEDDVVGRLELVADLRRARVEDEFVIHYQPVVELATASVVGVEALVRWQHPTRGLLAPSLFIPLAEETGRIIDVGAWVLDTACAQAARWRTELPGFGGLQLSVNVSTRQVRRPGLAEDVRAALARSGLEPAALTLEITETVLARREEMVSVLDEVTKLGVHLALDDFGTGYSSLSLLRDLPVHVLKIDRSFMQSIDGEGDSTAFLRAIIELAEALGLGVVAEGIETASHVAALLRLGCRLGQGFHFAAPLEPLELEATLAATVGSTRSRSAAA